jgi:ATP-dependent helicase HepA
MEDHPPTDIEFPPGTIVCLKSNPAIRGAVVARIQAKPEDRYQVFTDGDTQTFYASQIRVGQQDRPDQYLPCEEFHSYLTALQIRYPGLSTLYSLNAARIDFIPYQFRPVLRFIRSDRPRLLIADGVGVGKTIEAGLILRELQARRDIRSVLIICPRPLVTERKWQIEMKRFDERFSHLDGGKLRYCIKEMDLDGVWPDEYQRAILPYSLFDEALLHGTDPNRKRARKGLLDLDPPPRFDLVIVDEAHHIRNQDTYTHKAVRFFCDHAEAVVFLTATPIQLGNRDLFVLLNTLRPDLIIDRKSFEHMSEPNPFINQAIALIRAQQSEWTTQANSALNEAASTSWGQAILQHNPEFNRVRTQLAEENVTSEERVRLITDLEALHTFSGVINRTRRRDIGNFTIRKPETVIVEFTRQQRDLHDELLQIQAKIFSKLHGDNSVKFMMTTVRRQAASSLFGLVPFLDNMLSRHLDELLWEEADNSGTIPESGTIGAIETKIQDFLKKARRLDPDDPKLNILRKIIREKEDLPNNRVMLFSSFRHTLHYLFDHLKEDGFRVGMIHGGTPDEERVELRKQFERPRDHDESVDVLLFSEIGCEGLDYQFCDCMVNYDLPWNPMRVEQRIGRIDRNGQQSETVAIINLVTPGTVDADIYQRCLVRIGVFNSALGENEEILGEITGAIRDIAENFKLSDEEKGEKLQQLADNKIRLIQEQEELEQKQLELFGIRLPESQMQNEIEEASSFWLNPSSLYRLATTYLQRISEKDQQFIMGDKPLKTLRLSQEVRNDLLKDYQGLPAQNTPPYREWEDWLKGESPHLSVTFDYQCASQNPDTIFITPLHPLIKQASLIFDTDDRAITALKAESNEIPSGNYEFAIYQWQFHGIREDLILQPVASSPAITDHLASLLEKSEQGPASNVETIVPATWENLDTQHYTLWSEARQQHLQRTRELAAHRRESLKTSHKARISLLEEQLEQAENEKIQKMRQSQIAAAEIDYTRRIQGLDIAMERADITAEPVSYGVIQIDGDM